MYKISKIIPRQILDSRANPTIEVDLFLGDGSMGRASVPSGASTGVHEALELRDNDHLWNGKGVRKAVESAQNLAHDLEDGYFETQEALDSWLISQDSSENKSRLGANTILAISLSFAKAVAQSKKMPFFMYINELFSKPPLILPTPMFNLINGGKHANWSTDIQEFMIIVKENEYDDQLRMACEIFHKLEKILERKHLSTNVGNEGGFAPGFRSNSDGFDFLISAIEEAGYSPGVNVFLGVDFAASEFYQANQKIYELKKEGRKVDSGEWIEMIFDWVDRYPIISIEDPLSEDDWENWIILNEKLGSKIQIVGDDLLVTNQKRIAQAIELNACNALLVKPNQIGTLTETLVAMKKAQNAGWNNIVSHRSGETEDTTIAHISVGTGCGQIKTGAPSRGERTTKYNELLRIREILYNNPDNG